LPAPASASPMGVPSAPTNPSSPSLIPTPAPIVP
jgi:hypothetical protein